MTHDGIVFKVTMLVFGNAGKISLTLIYYIG